MNLCAVLDCSSRLALCDLFVLIYLELPDKAEINHAELFLF